MKTLFCISFTILLSGLRSCGQESYKEVLLKGLAAPNYRGYVDREGIFYESRGLNDVAAKVLIKDASFFSSDSSFHIIGKIVTEGSNDHGFCCFRLFLAQAAGDSLLNIVMVGETSNENVDPKKDSGDFDINIKPVDGQWLFIAAGNGRGLFEFNLEGVIKKSRHRMIY